MVVERWTSYHTRSPWGLVLLTPDGKVVGTNPTYRGMVGAGDGADIHSTRFVDSVVVDDTARVEAAVGMSLANQGLPQTALVRLNSRGGSNWSKLTFTTVADRGGAPLMVAVYVEDHDEQVAALTRLGDSTGTSLVGMVASGVVHDLRNLLAVVGGHVELVAIDQPAGEVKDRLEVVRAAVARADAITAQLMRLTRPTAMVPALADVAGLVRGMEPLLAAVVPAKRLTVEANQPALVEVDPVQLERAILSLVVNAREAVGPDGGVRVTVTRGQGRALIEVRDDGSGIDPQTLDRVFEPFFTTKGEGGTGLGLPTARAMVKAFGGELTLTSAVGVGTTASIWLPIAYG